MADDNSFAEFLRRVRAGDQQAAVELVRRYETAIRVEVRLRMTNPRMSRVLDSMDVCQSVLGSFFVRAAAGQYDLESPYQLLQLLVKMARNKVALQARREHTQRRGHGRHHEPAGNKAVEAAADGPPPERIVAGEELLAEVRRRLSAEERDIADRRGAGQGWAEIAAALGGTAEGRRKQLGRALDSIAADLGLDET